MGFSRQKYWSGVPLPSLTTLLINYKKVKELVSQSCPTLCNPIHCSSPGSSVHGILQARILEQIVIPFSWLRDQTRVSCIAGRFFTIWATRELHPCLFHGFNSIRSLSRVWLFATPWTAAHQASLFITNSRLLRLMSIESVMSYNHIILCLSLLLLPSIFLSIRVFSNDRFFAQVLEFQLQHQSFQWILSTDFL